MSSDNNLKYSLTSYEIVNILKKHGLFVTEKSTENLLLNGITYNSRDVDNGYLFICKGLTFKEQYLLDAESRGAVLYISEKEYLSAKIPYILVNDIRKAMSLIAQNFYGNPSRYLKLTGITGTKGKTTTTYFLKNILDVFNRNQTGVLSTVEVYTGKTSEESHLTTPESLDMQRFFAEAVESELGYLTMEVSSQAYKQWRVYNQHYDVAMFLNIGCDHIGDQEHTDFEDYFSCKLELMKNCDTAIIYAESDYVGRILEAAKGAKRVITYGSGQAADYRLTNVENQKDGLSFTVENNGQKHTYKISMHGRFNAENALAALIAAKQYGADEKSIEEGLMNTKVQGRMNIYYVDERDLTVIVDYAHNYVSFKKLYESCKLDYPGKRIVVLTGAPGGHAQQRRIEIPELANEYADFCYITTEDPQFEDPNDICEAMASILRNGNTAHAVIIDRTKAVETAVNDAQDGDVVIIAGKGEETYQKIKGKYVPCESDLSIVKRLLNIKD